MKYLLTLSLTLLAATAASAQTTFRLGVRGGINRALTTVDPAGNQSGTYPYSYSTDKAAITAWQAGAVADISFGKLAVQPALLFSQKGEKIVYALTASGITGNDYYEISSTNRYNWLELPLNVVYTLHGDHGLQLLAGPYLALAVGGRQQGTYVSANPYSRTQPVDFDQAISYGSRSYNRRLDAGLNFGLGYRQGPVQMQLLYGLGLRNLHMRDESDYVVGGPKYVMNYYAQAAYNRVLQLTGTYFFKL